METLRLAVLAAAAVLSSCASTPRATPPPTVYYRPGLEMTEPRPQGDCARGPAYPEQAARDGIAGPVIVDLVVDQSGHATSVEPIGDTAPALLESVERWAKGCTFAPGTLKGSAVPMSLRKIYQLHPARDADPAEAPAIELRNGDHVSRPEPVGCVPSGPPRLGLEGSLLVSYVVHRGGYADSVRFGPGAPPALASLVGAWIGSCTFRPARAPDGSAVAARVEDEIFAYDDPVVRLSTTDPAGDARLLANGVLSRPVGKCEGPRPAWPDQARQTGTLGTVLMRYVVHTDGHAGEMAVLNSHAPPILVDSVKRWLSSCRFDPSRDQSGKAVAIAVVQPFLFRVR